ncbi:serine hydrolase [Cyclobacterium marinum]|uniref:serine hydrolase n=1 Tax=Cyclobacterium marinum TaxID=104 RepID=UPI00030851C8|nr:serine hydrolase [Cyclobacterium marinum]
MDEEGKAPGFCAAGWQDREKRIPVHPKTLFKIASKDKLYDAVTMVKLFNSNRLTLGGSVAIYLPELVKIENAAKPPYGCLLSLGVGYPITPIHQIFG